MTKEKALEILNDYVTRPAFTGLPIVDDRIIYIRPKEFEEITLDWVYEEYPMTVTEEYTFKGLIKIAYDL